MRENESDKKTQKKKNKERKKLRIHTNIIALAQLGFYKDYLSLHIDSLPLAP